MGVTVRWAGVDRLEARLRGLQGQPLSRTARKALVRGGRKVVPTMAAYAPRGSGTGSTTKKQGRAAGLKLLRYAMSSRQGRDGVAAVVGPRAKWAPHRNLVARGTRPHVIRARDGGALFFGGELRPFVNHPGARSNDYITRAWNARRADAMREVSRFLVSEASKEADA